MPTTNKRARISTLLGNTRTMAVIAFLLAIVIWLAVSINESPVVERVVQQSRRMGLAGSSAEANHFSLPSSVSSTKE